MKTQYLAGFVVLAGCVGVTALQAQDEFGYDLPAGAGPYVRVGVGPSGFENGRLEKFGPSSPNSSVDFDPGVS